MLQEFLPSFAGDNVLSNRLLHGVISYSKQEVGGHPAQGLDRGGKEIHFSFEVALFLF